MSAQPPIPEQGTAATEIDAGSEAPPAVDAPAASFSHRTASPSKRRVGIVAGAALALGAVAAATSFAASPPPSTSPSSNGPSIAAPNAQRDKDGSGRFGGRFGQGAFRDITIAAISGNDVTLATADGWRRTITLTSSVKLTRGGQTIAVGDLKVGDQVRFRQTRNADGTFTVTDLAVVVPTIRGEVSGVTSRGFKVTTRNGSVWTVTVNGSTTYWLGTGDGSLSDVKNGGTVVVSGNSTGDNALTALRVRVAPTRAVGTVSAKTADSITIKLRDGSSKVIHVGANTTFRVAGNKSAKLADVAVDMVVGATGRARADGSIDADVVAAGKLRQLRNGAGNGRFDGPAQVTPDVFGPTNDGSIDGPTA